MLVSEGGPGVRTVTPGVNISPQWPGLHSLCLLPENSHHYTTHVHAGTEVTGVTALKPNMSSENVCNDTRQKSLSFAK